MRVIRLLCLASLLALVMFSGTAEPSTVADAWDGEGPTVIIEAEESAKEEDRQDSAGIRITMTGISEDGEDHAREDTAGITVTITGEAEAEEEDGARASVTLRARTGSQDGC